MKLFLITDRGVASFERTLERARAVLKTHTDVIFGVRDHALSARERTALAHALIAVARPRGARVVIHDRVDIALAVDADGVHLAERSISAAEARSLMPRAYVSRSCHDERGIEAARDCDAITLSPLFASPGKGEPLGAERFARLAARSRVPVFALGGISFANAADALAAGAMGVAMIRGWLAD